MFRDIPLAAVSKPRGPGQGGAIWSCRRTSPASVPAPSAPVMTVDQLNPQWGLRIAESSGQARNQGHAPQEGTKGYKNRGSGRPTLIPSRSA